MTTNGGHFMTCRPQCAWPVGGSGTIGREAADRAQSKRPSVKPAASVSTMKLERIAARQQDLERPGQPRALGRRVSALRDARPALWPWLVVLFLGAAALSVWFLVGPLFGPGPYYRSALNRSTYGF